MTAGIAFTLMVLAAVLSYWQSGESGLLLAAPVLAVGAAATLRQMRQQAADLDGKIAAAQLAAQEVGTEIGQLRDAVQAREPDKRVMTDEERAKLTTLTARQKTQREILTSLLEEKQALTEDLAAAEAAESGFFEFISLMFSDSGVILVSWQNFLLALAETLPAASLALLLAVAVIFLQSFKIISRDLKFVYGYR